MPANDFELYYQGLKNFGRHNLEPTTKEPTIPELIAEGDKLLAEQPIAPKTIVPEKPKAAPKKKSVPNNSANPYQVAREQILAAMEKDKRDQILEMEKKGDTNNKAYHTFVQLIIKRAERP